MLNDDITRVLITHICVAHAHNRRAASHEMHLLTLLSIYKIVNKAFFFALGNIDLKGPKKKNILFV